MLGLQNQVASAITRGISHKVRPKARRATLENRRAINLEAYEAYLGASARRGPWTGFTTRLRTSNGHWQGNRTTLKLTWDWPMHTCSWGTWSPCLLRERSQGPRAMLKALQLDDYRAELHVLFGDCEVPLRLGFPGCEKGFAAGARSCNPNSVYAHSYYSDFLSAMGRPDEAIVEEIRIRQIDALSVSAGVAMQQCFGRVGSTPP